MKTAKRTRIQQIATATIALLLIKDRALSLNSMSECVFVFLFVRGANYKRC